MKILGLDTAQGACSSALWEDGRVRARRFELMRTGHAERLVPQLLEVMEAAACEMGALDRLASTVGPGTFTGTRVALATARAMALALDIPLIGVTTLEAVAAAVTPDEGKVRVAAFDAKRGELYVQAFEGARLAPLSEPARLEIEAAAKAVIGAAGARPMMIAGTGAGLLARAIAGEGGVAETPNVQAHPDAAMVAEIAADRTLPALPPAPFYLREPDAKLPGPK